MLRLSSLYRRGTQDTGGGASNDLQESHDIKLSRLLTADSLPVATMHYWSLEREMKGTPYSLWEPTLPKLRHFHFIGFSETIQAIQNGFQLLAIKITQTKPDGEIWAFQAREPRDIREKKGVSMEQTYKEAQRDGIRARERLFISHSQGHMA